MSERTGLEIAVVGGGIAGLSVAWRLSARHRVTLMEKHAVAGMDAHSIDLAHEGERWRVDVPLRVLYEGYYPTLIALYHSLGVQLERTNYAGSFSRLGGDTYYRYANWLVGGRSIPLPAFPLGATALRINRDLLRFYAVASAAGRRLGESDEPLGSWLDRTRIGAEFAEGFLVPAFAAVCTCSSAAVRAYPARVILDYLMRGLTFGGVRRVVLGTREVVKRLTEPLAEVRCGVEVRGVAPAGRRMRVQWAGGEQQFDHVVIAAQANQAAPLLEQTHRREREALERFAYERSAVVVHTDPRLAPRDRRHWAPVNLICSDAHDKPMATIWMNRVQPGLRDRSPVFQTWNPIVEPRADSVHAHAWFERPVVNAASVEAARAVRQLQEQPGRRLWFCGSYLGPGIPLLESAARTAADVAAAIADDGRTPLRLPSALARPA
ncbi:MAG: FAD-dependent oxidoreductase [Gemmatimonadaceae bacterium]